MHLLSVFSLRNRSLIALITICAALFGGISITTLKQELFPSISLPQLFVATSYPGASPDVVEHDVSTPIESAIQNVDGLESTTATSSTNTSTVTASFEYGTNLATAEQKVQSAINRIANRLPDDVDPQVLTFSFADLPAVQIAVTSDLDPTELADRIESSTLPDLRDLGGVSDASLIGATGQRVQITPDADELARLGLTNQAITDALSANGVLLPSGEITEHGQTLTVQAGVQLHSVQDIEKLPVLGATTAQSVPSLIPGGTSTTAQVPDADVHTIGDVASVKIVDDPVTGISRVNGEPSVTISVSKAAAGNTVDISREVTDALPDLQKAVGGGTTFTVVFDQAPYIEQSIESLAQEGVLGLVFAVIVILVFLLSIRSTLVTAVSIPVSVLITFIGMWATGYTLNILTLGALTIAIGRVVDDSIVVIENIKRHITADRLAGAFDADPKAAKIVSIRAAVREVAGAVTASTLTTVAVFLPLALVGSEVGELFRPFALTVTIALAASLFVALTIVPVLAYWFLGTRASKREIAEHAHAARLAPATATGADAAIDELDRPNALQRVYLPVIRWTLRFPALVIVAAILVLVGTLGLVPSLKTNFLGSSGQNTLTVSQELPAGTSLDVQDAAATTVEHALLDVKGVDIVQLSLGSTSGGSFASFGSSGGATFSITTDADADQEAVQDRVRTAIDGLDDVGDVTIGSGGGGGFTSSDIAITVRAATAADLTTASDAVLDAVKGLDVTAQATSDLATTQPYLRVAVDRAKAAAKGLSELQVGRIVTAAMNPSSVGSVEVDDTTLSIYLNDSARPTTQADLKAFEVPTADGPVKLSTIADVSVEQTPASITTEKGVRTSTVTVTPNGDDVGAASAAVTKAVDAVDLPDSASAEIGGVTSDQSDAFLQLGLALLASILIVYVIMVATFKSLLQPLLLLVSVPFAATGAILLQVVTSTPLGVPSIIGVIMLVGIVVTNAIVLIDLVNQYRSRGSGVRDAIVHGAARRLRPILMTALATIFALVPSATGITGHGGFISQPLALVVIGGLVSSTVLTLIVLPTLYWAVFGRRERRDARRARRARAAAAGSE
ncbi:efflux RND transporter permease subunit [Galbitalea sp. SE-J8]|uniref:efflux RND transporter permease subunit n=1 Tax=Galbitalea sp. SE-J8 TaxID=3054952 RepID=UPI00259C8C60|nr:efflux RND transporter permease subunit [Galbitalea sp. SE-J8]MDM4762211.1 efflux RND transporter permease subunit [Galbitalea sp. SE-J8]